MQTTDNPYVFTWKGTLNAGELKFTCDKQEDWNGAWFMPAVADKQPAGETEPMLFLDKSDEAFKAQYLGRDGRRHRPEVEDYDSRFLSDYFESAGRDNFNRETIGIYNR